MKQIRKYFDATNDWRNGFGVGFRARFGLAAGADIYLQSFGW